MEQLLDEEVGAADHRPEPDQELERRSAPVGGSVARRLRSRISGSSVSSLLHLAAAAQRARDVDAVGEHEDDARRRSAAPSGRPSPSASADGEEDEEEDQVALQRLGVRARARGPARAGPGRGARRARPAPSRSSRAGTARRRSRRSRRPRSPRAPPIIATIGISVSGIAVPTAASRLPDRALAERQPVARPLDRVGEQQRAGEDHREADDEEDVRPSAELDATQA